MLHYGTALPDWLFIEFPERAQSTPLMAIKYGLYFALHISLFSTALQGVTKTLFHWESCKFCERPCILGDSAALFLTGLLLQYPISHLACNNAS